MSWTDFLQTARVRALEEADTSHALWDTETRRSATSEAQATAGKTTSAFLPGRADKLLSQIKKPELPEALSLAALPSWSGLLLIIAFIVGWGLSALGQEREINLLALPLLGILLWNLIVMTWSIFSSFSKPELPGVMGSFLQRQARSESAKDSLLIAAKKNFRSLVASLQLTRLAHQLRLWFHLAAAILALGSVCGMYARGWSREYRAVWESTLLSEPAAQGFFTWLFLPASKVTGVAIPLDKLPEMRRHHETAAAQPGPALPWIHLYAATLGLMVIAPRLLLVGFEGSRLRRLTRQAWKSADWQAYQRRLLAQVDGQGAPVLILTHGLPVDAAAEDRWRLAAHSQWQDAGKVALQSVPVGAETEFAEAWQPASLRVMLIFNLANTPEAEVHRRLVELLLEKRSATADFPLLLSLDESALQKRLAGFGDAEKRLSERRTSWQQMLHGLDIVWSRAM
jgi:hypothetical protein